MVGYSNLSGDITFHAFLWTKEGGMQDLGTLPGDFFSFGEAINEGGQVGGFSCDINFNCRAFVWRSGLMTDLNTLIPANASLFLVDVLSINSHGEIAGDAVEISTGERHAYLATPSNGQGSESAVSVATGETSQRPRIVLSDNVRQLLQQRPGFGRFIHIPQVPLGKTAVTSAPTATLSPTSLIFSIQAIGTTSAAKAVTLKNTGTASLTISGIAITGTNAGDFSQGTICGTSLAAGASCKISIKFKPTASGTRTAALSIRDNASGSPQKVVLSGL